MKKKMLRKTSGSILAFWTLSVLALGLVTSCESVLFIELEEGERLIVLNGAVSNDSLFEVQLSRTRHILDNASLAPLEAAAVTVYRGGDQVAQLDYLGNGIYGSASFRPSAGQEYRVAVQSEGLPDAEARTTIPPSVPILRVDTSSVYEMEEYWDWSYTWGTFSMDVHLEDPPGEENFYLVSMATERSYTTWRDTTVLVLDSLFQNGIWYPYVKDSTYAIADIYRFREGSGLNSEDLIVEANTSAGILFSDQLIDGKAYSVRVSLPTDYLTSADSAVSELRLHSISEDYYKYLKSRQKHYEAVDDFLAVPVIVYSNVDGGTGFFGGFSTDVHTFTTFVPEYRWDYYYYDK
ncbi:MAG: DUF4249 domain-containing protein [Bacteroidales bacterium]